MHTGGYQANKGDHETGLYNKKYSHLQHNDPTPVPTDNGKKGMFYYIYNWNNGDPMQLETAQDFFYLRYADVLLMHSELTETATGINAVRARADLLPVAYSLDNLKKERLYELAFEGLRWFDLVRWGDVEKADKNYFSTPCNVMNSGGECCPPSDATGKMVFNLNGGANSNNRVYEIKEFTADRMTLFVSNAAWSTGWTWVFKPAA